MAMNNKLNTIQKQRWFEKCVFEPSISIDIIELVEESFKNQSLTSTTVAINKIAIHRWIKTKLVGWFCLLGFRICYPNKPGCKLKHIVQLVLQLINGGELTFSEPTFCMNNCSYDYYDHALFIVINIVMIKTNIIFINVIIIVIIIISTNTNTSIIIISISI
jgi:hypothetical protein